ncbi:flippase-like domain-containing protein, partial [bacterium]|nr:flippase-like domain-containing protein [bacterium]
MKNSSRCLNFKVSPSKINSTIIADQTKYLFMKKADLQIIIKILVSIIFLFLLFIKIDIQNSLKVLNNCHKPLAFTALIITISTAFLLALRLFILIKKQIGSEKVNYFNIFKLTMVGIFFNNFLPTGAGGDIAKAFFLVKEEQNKLLVGSSVLIDRFLGALTVIFMGTVSAWLTPELPTKYKVFLLSILLLLFSFILLFTNRNIANFFKFLLKNRLPVNLKNKLQTIYLVFSSYFLAKKSIALAILISIITQTISIIGNYLMGVSLVG